MRYRAWRSPLASDKLSLLIYPWGGVHWDLDEIHAIRKRLLREQSLKTDERSCIQPEAIDAKDSDGPILSDAQKKPFRLVHLCVWSERKFDDTCSPACPIRCQQSLSIVFVGSRNFRPEQPGNTYQNRKFVAPSPVVQIT